MNCCICVRMCSFAIGLAPFKYTRLCSHAYEMVMNIVYRFSNIFILLMLAATYHFVTLSLFLPLSLSLCGVYIRWYFICFNIVCGVMLVAMVWWWWFCSTSKTFAYWLLKISGCFKLLYAVFIFNLAIAKYSCYTAYKIISL